MDMPPVVEVPPLVTPPPVVMPPVVEVPPLTLVELLAGAPGTLPETPALGAPIAPEDVLLPLETAPPAATAATTAEFTVKINSTATQC